MISIGNEASTSQNINCSALPMSKPQPSLYPHIYSTPGAGDLIISNHGREDSSALASSVKPPVFNNPYLVSS